MERSLIWLEGDTNGWACSNCQWRFLVPTLLAGEDAMAAYDRLAAAKFQEHQCEAASAPAKLEIKPEPDSAFAARARLLIKRGYKPKVAVELVLQEKELECLNDPAGMQKARAEAEDFLLRIRKGLI
jgi:hypothetical protein